MARMIESVNIRLIGTIREMLILRFISQLSLLLK
jgi:hypothetical protein